MEIIGEATKNIPYEVREKYPSKSAKGHKLRKNVYSCYSVFKKSGKEINVDINSVKQITFSICLLWVSCA
jgi:uncharacterized protein with HEPN domain